MGQLLALIVTAVAAAGCSGGPSDAEIVHLLEGHPGLPVPAARVTVQGVLIDAQEGIAKVDFDGSVVNIKLRRYDRGWAAEQIETRDGRWVDLSAGFEMLVAERHTAKQALARKQQEAPVPEVGPAPLKRTKYVPPQYPSIARAAGVEGVVVLNVTVAADGQVQDAVIARSIPLFDEAALTAVRQWQYEPPGGSGPMSFPVEVPFRLK